MKKITYLKKIAALVLVIALSFLAISQTINAEQVRIAKTTGGYVTHLDSSEYVYINTEYIQKDRDFRACWVSPLVGDIPTYQNKAQYQEEMLKVFDDMEVYNLNVMVFHVRIMNDAFYKSNYADWSEYYSTNPDWEALPWIIEECHKRGIEFHAWMNPYRVIKGQANLTDLAKKFSASNMACDPANLLQGENSVILNPGIPKIRDWLVKVCMEVVKNYDVDAIHFDDYFYDYKVDDSQTRLLYNTEGLSLGDFRRKQVDTFIENLSNAIRTYNKDNGRCVQLGISPSGVYRSGNGVVTYNSNGDAITNGSLSKTSFIHYDDYLYSDTLKWINEEWIDYILPQAYWAIEHPLCPYADLMEWWNKVVEYKKVNLYAGLGLYQRTSTGGYSWYTNNLEAYNEIMIANSLNNVNGVCFFPYADVKQCVKNNDIMKGVKEIWATPAITPEVQNSNTIIPEKVTNLDVYKTSSGYKLSFLETDKTRFYVIYRSENPITFNQNEVIDVIGDCSENGIINYPDAVDNTKKYYYGVKSQSYSLTLGEGISAETDQNKTSEQCLIGSLEDLHFGDALQNGQTTSLTFGKINYPFGDQVQYELTYSFDDGQERIVNSFSKKANVMYCDIKVPQNAKVFSGKLVAYNNVGRVEKEITEKVLGQLPKVDDFTISGSSYTDNRIICTWRNSYLENATYTVQISENGFDWVDSSNSIAETSSVNLRTRVTIPSSVGKYYFRVKISKDGSNGYSDVISLDVYNYLGKLANYTINKETPLNEYQLAEGEELIISFRRTSDSINYSLYVSNDMEHWASAKTYNSALKISEVDGQITYTIPINYLFYKFYLKIEASSETSKFTSEYITVNVQMECFFPDEFIKYINDEMENYMNRIDLFK